MRSERPSSHVGPLDSLSRLTSRGGGASDQSCRTRGPGGLRLEGPPDSRVHALREALQGPRAWRLGGQEKGPSTTPPLRHLPGLAALGPGWCPATGGRGARGPMGLWCLRPSPLNQAGPSRLQWNWLD